MSRMGCGWERVWRVPVVGDPPSNGPLTDPIGGFGFTSELRRAELREMTADLDESALARMRLDWGNGSGGPKVPGSNPGSPTTGIHHGRPVCLPENSYGLERESDYERWVRVNSRA